MGRSLRIAAGLTSGAGILAGIAAVMRPRVIDSWTGREVKIGETLVWPDGSQVTLHDVDAGLLSARALVTTRGTGERGSIADLDRQWQPLGLRYTHPSFPFQKIAFIPS